MRQDHLVAAGQLSRADVERVLDRAAEFDAALERGDEPPARYPEKLLALCFYEPSTRTKMSFETAMKRLGGDVVDMGGVDASSVKKGESLADTVRVVEGYADGLVLRHPREGAAKMAAEFVDVPVVNAGDGAGHHPSQTLLDLYTIREADSPGRSGSTSTRPARRSGNTRASTRYCPNSTCCTSLGSSASGSPTRTSTRKSPGSSGSTPRRSTPPPTT